MIFATEPLWTVPIAIFTLYAPLYMRALGLSALDIGVVNSIYLGCTVVGAALGGTLADRWGRKRTLMIFDALVWLVMPVLWATARSFWYFAAASALSGLGFLVLPAWECLYIEDVKPERRAAVYGVFQFIFFGSGLLAPLGGYMVDRYSLVPAMRGIYLFTLASVSAGLLIRLFLVQETSVGRRMLLNPPATESLMARHRRSLAILTRNRDLGLLTLMLGLVQFSWGLWTPFAPQYFTDEDGLGIGVRTISFVPAVFSGVMAVVSLAVVARARHERYRRAMVVGGLASALGVMALMVSPGGNVTLLLLFTSIWALGVAMVGPIRQTAWANLAGDGDRAALLSTAAALSFAFAAPAGVLGGWLYTVNPRGPFLLLFLVQLAVVGLAACVSKNGRSHKRDALKNSEARIAVQSML